MALNDERGLALAKSLPDDRGVPVDDTLLQLLWRGENDAEELTQPLTDADAEEHAESDGVGLVEEVPHTLVVAQGVGVADKDRLGLPDALLENEAEAVMDALPQLLADKDADAHALEDADEEATEDAEET